MSGRLSGQLILGGQRLALTRCNPPVCTPDALAAFAGSYESREVESRHTISVRGAELIVEYGLGCDKGLAFAMEPIAPDVFLVRPTAPGIAYRHVFRFDRDAAGRVTSAVVTMERLKGLRLWRDSTRISTLPPCRTQARTALSVRPSFWSTTAMDFPLSRINRTDLLCLVLVRERSPLALGHGPLLAHFRAICSVHETGGGSLPICSRL